MHGERTPVSQRGVEIHLYGLDAFLAAFAAVHANDPASARVLEKAGFACEGVQIRGFQSGQLLDLIVYARVRDSLESSS